MTKRLEFQLTIKERDAFDALRIPGDARTFWDRVAVVRGLDPATILCIDGKPSGLPMGHSKHWCWPLALECKHKPARA